MSTDLQRAQRRIAQLESELDEMTLALSQAWDQLVPLLQEHAPQDDYLSDILLMLDSVMVATESNTTAIFLTETQVWRSLPSQDIIPLPLMHAIQKGALPAHEWSWQSEHGEKWLFAPIIVESSVVGTIGIGLSSRSSKTSFSAVDTKLLRRIAERIAGQMIAMQLAITRELAAKNAHEMEIASTIQRSIQPAHPPRLNNVDIASFWQSARLVGGDAWGWVLQSSGQLCLFVLDVAGKGLPAALGAVSLHAAIRIGLRANMTPAEVLAMVNDEFYEAYTATGLLTTATVIRIDPATGVFEQANAGHPPTLIHHQGVWRELAATMPPLGVLEGFAPITQTLQLEPCDLVICYSDGFSEIETATGLWGQKGIMEAAPKQRDGAQEVIDAIITKANSVQQSIENIDDQTLIATCILSEE